MSSLKFRNIFYLGLLVVMAACSPAEQEDEDSNVVASLEGSNWHLVQLTVLGGFVFTPDDSSKYRLNFRSENRLTGTSDCNTIGGAWVQENSALRFEPFSTTRSLCAPGSLHNNLVLYLKDTATYSFRDDHLVLRTPTDGVEIELKPAD